MRTVAGLRVGATVADFRKVHGRITLADAECALYASAPSLVRIVFRVEAKTDDCAKVVDATANPAELAGTSKPMVLYVNGR